MKSFHVAIVSAKRVIVVDDEQWIEQLIEKRLEKAGYVHASFTDPEYGLAYFNEYYREINLTIIDLRMPKMTGHQMAKKMHELSRPTDNHHHRHS